MFQKSVLFASALLGAASAQQVGTNTPETHPKITTYKCTKAGGCISQAQSVTIDANWRWTHVTSGYTNCYTGNTWNTTACPDGKTCVQNCALEGADYSGTYGITTTGDALSLKFVTQGSSGANIGSRVYLMDTDTSYQMFNLKNQEFTFDVDTSNLPCGLNGALYFVEMDADGGMAKFPTNKAGAKYGTGYCDTQCPHDMKFINGEANVLDWTPSTSDKNGGTGRYGACCNEMDIWEANSISAAYTPHVCSNVGLLRCEGAAQCGDGDSRYTGVCDKDGCDFNSYRMGDTGFYGPGKTIDSKKKVTVVTQFITSDGTSSGDLVEIRRKYVQNGVVFENSVSKIPGVTGNSVTDAYCDAQKSVFGDTNQFESLGGLATMGDSFSRGMVLSLSVWDDHSVNMLWLDSTYPTDSTKLGAARGSCSTDSGVPSVIEVSNASASVTYSNIRWGEINSTFTGSGSTTPGNPGGSTTLVTSKTSTSSAPPSGSTGVAKYGQCGGSGYTGPTTCIASTCTKLNDFYSQCL